MEVTMSKLVFHKIINDRIFTTDFSTFISNNTIDFNDKNISVLYGPNGTGKTSLIQVLLGSKGTAYNADYDGVSYDESNTSLFYVIQDQSSRNIIAGTAKDFLLGDDIQREFSLSEYLTTERNRILSEIIATLKNIFGISSASSKAVELITVAELKNFVKDLANTKSKGGKYKTTEILRIIDNLPAKSIPEFSEDKLTFVIRDISDKDSLIKKINALILNEFVANHHVHEIEENTEAMRILEKFSKKCQCIVCDTTGIDSEQLLKKKTSNRETVIQSIDDKLRGAVEHVISLTGSNDPFSIKEKLLHAIDTGDVGVIVALKSEFLQYYDIFNCKIIDYFRSVFESSDIKSKNQEYELILSGRPAISDEDLFYIESIVGDSMGKPLRVDRDENNTLRISLSNHEFLNKERDELPLSTGEQNFLSLSFEFLKAKNSTSPIVVIDDPISSFDSIYKNKIVFALVRMLKDKKRVVLTHNTDVLRLLNAQYSNCFNLYILNNTSGESNGFIPLKPKEKDMLIDLEKLLDGFRNDIVRAVVNMDEYLISMISFCRGYAALVGNKDVKDQLTNVMHGYKTEAVDIAQAYISLFGNKTGLIPSTFVIRVEDILRRNSEMTEILDSAEYPLLNKTLKHTMTYLMLRLLVEKTLVEKKNISLIPHMQLGQIIDKSFPGADMSEIRMRVRLTSKKTLINEFNHFNGNLSIFQPAIDITNSSLSKEKNDIINAVESINNGGV